MKQFCAASLVSLLIFCGCGRSGTPPAVLPQTPPAQLDIQSVKFLDHTNESISPAAMETSRIRWEVLIAEFGEDAIQQHGLKQLFDKAVEKNRIISDEISRSHLVAMARADSNIVLNLTAGVFAGTCTAQTASNLITHFKQAFGVDLLTQPQATTMGIDKARLYVGNNIPVVTGALANSGPTAPFITNLSFGHTVTLRALASMPEKLELDAVARFDDFGGYSRDHQARPNQPTLGDPPIFNCAHFRNAYVLEDK